MLMPSCDGGDEGVETPALSISPPPLLTKHRLADRRWRNANGNAKHSLKVPFVGLMDNPPFLHSEGLCLISLGEHKVLRNGSWCFLKKVEYIFFQQ